MSYQKINGRKGAHVQIENLPKTWGDIIDHFFGARVGIVIERKGREGIEVGLAPYQYVILIFILWLIFW